MANPLELPDARSARERLGLYAMWGSTGGYSAVNVYVWARSFDQAFELFVEWLDDHAPGVLDTIGEPELAASAAELGVPWPLRYPDEDPRLERVIEHAESGFTPIGHTTLDHGTHIQSDHWGGHEVTDPDEYDSVYEWSRYKYRQEYGEDPV